MFALQLREHNHKHKTIVSFNALLLPSTEGWWWMMTVWIGRTSHPIFKSVVTFFLLLSLQIVFGIPTNNCVLCRLPPLFSQMAHIVDVKSFVFTSRKRSFAHNSCCCSCFCCDSRQKKPRYGGCYTSLHTLMRWFLWKRVMHVFCLYLKTTTTIKHCWTSFFKYKKLLLPKQNRGKIFSLTNDVIFL